jgi:hypothetical protein
MLGQRADSVQGWRAHGAAGLTRSELARQDGMSHGSVYCREWDRGTPRPATLAKLARVLGPELLGGVRGGEGE